jgi:hypothetical protein
MSPDIASFLSAPIPDVDPEDIKRIWPLVASGEGGMAIDRRVFIERCGPGANVTAVFVRAILVRAMMEQGLLNRWLENNTPQNQVFAVAATAPLTPQEGALGFDGEAFLAALE